MVEGGSPTSPPGRRGIAFWRSPADQPRWARPMLVTIAVASAALYSWRAGTYLEVYYAAAVRSMSMSWHNFFFAAFDPAGTVSLDKLPGSFWVQALSVRMLGVHTWVIVLPQVVEGVHVNGRDALGSGLHHPRSSLYPELRFTARSGRNHCQLQ